MKKILFVIHDLHHGGAEKVLVNLVNNMDRENFDITVMALFGGGVNEQFLKKDVKLIICHKRAVRGNSKIMKLFSPQFLFSYYIKDKYDILFLIWKDRVQGLYQAAVIRTQNWFPGFMWNSMTGIRRVMLSEIIKRLWSATGDLTVQYACQSM